MTAPARILHLHSSFSLGGKEARATRLMNLMGPRAEHVILSAAPDALGARAAIAQDIVVEFPGAAAPALHGRPGLGRYRALARYMQGFDLVLSYNWGAMDGVMAHRLMSPFMPLPPLIHHEDGFNEDEALRRNWKRNAFRRLALPTAKALVVPSELLVRIASAEWSREATLIRNGIDVARYAAPPDVKIPQLERAADDVVIGTVAGLRKVKNLSALVIAAGHVKKRVKLAIVGEGPERQEIITCAISCGWDNRFVMPGFMAEPHRWIGHFDILALSSLSEQAPIAVIEAMAAGKPIASYDVGDVKAMVSPENQPFIVSDPHRLADALGHLASDAKLRQRIGAANAARAAELFEETIMVGAYDRLYASALSGRSLFTA